MVSGGTKNKITYSRKETQLNSNQNQRSFYLSSSLNTIFYSDHLFINPIESPTILLSRYPLSTSSSSLFPRLCFEFVSFLESFIFYYYLFINVGLSNLMLYNRIVYVFDGRFIYIIPHSFILFILI